MSFPSSTARSAIALVVTLAKGKPGKPTAPIVRGHYQTSTQAQRATVTQDVPGATPQPADVLVELVTKDWICGTILGPAKAKYPFAARIQSPRFP